MSPDTREKMRIAALIGNLNKKHGGAQQQLYDVFRRLTGEFSPVVYVMFGPATFRDDFEEAGVRICELGASSNVDVHAFVRLVRDLRAEAPDLLQTNSPISGIWGRIAARLSGVPRVVSVEQNVHHGYRLLPRLANGLTLFFADDVVGVSEAVVDSLAGWERALLRPGTRIHTIHNSVDLGRFEEAADGPDSGTDATVVGSVGRLTEAKGYEYAVRAWPRVLGELRGQLRLRLVGDGPLRPKLEALVRELGIEETVSFAGYREDPVPELRRFDVGVFPSLWEGLPLAVAEAMAAGVPVVTSDIAPLRTLVGPAGVTVPAGDPAALGRSLIELLRDSDRRERLAAAGRRRVRRRFSADRVAKEYGDLYRSRTPLG